MLRIKVFLIIIYFVSLNSAFSDVLKPNDTIKPKQVVKIQLDGLKKKR